MSVDSFARHLEKAQYGDFRLTDAVRPAPEVPVVPREGFRFETYEDRRSKVRIPVLAAAISSERLFEVFLDLLRPLTSVVDVVLETSHQSEGATHKDLVREEVDLPVLQSHLYDYEDLLLNDGCTGVAVISADQTQEVQFDEHKILVVYAHDLEPFEEILRQAGVPRVDDLKLITEGEHLHSTDPRYEGEFEQLCFRLGIGEFAAHVSQDQE